MRIEVNKTSPQELIHSYAACQSASVAFAYDNTNPRFMDYSYISGHPTVQDNIDVSLLATISALESPGIPEAYGHFPYAYPETSEYFTGIDGAVSGNISNVHNWTDSALAAWMVGQWQKPDVGWGYGGVLYSGRWWRDDGITGTQILSLYSDAPEVLAHIAEAKSPALGASVEGGNDTQNVMRQNLNTMTEFSEEQRFTGDDEDHSAQFRSINMRRWEFWDRLLRDEEIFDIQTDYPNTQ